MADLNDLQAAQSVKIVGSNSTGVETNAVNASASGELLVTDTTLIQNTDVFPRKFTVNSQSFVSSIANINVGTTEAGFFLLRNPGASGKIVRISKILLNADPAKSGVLFRMYFQPTITANGAALAEVNLRNMTSPNTAVATAFSIPTISSNGTFLYEIWLSASNSGYDLPMEILNILDQGFDFLITTAAGANNTLTSVSVFWSEQ